MPNAHYFETYIRLPAEKLKDILLSHGVVIGQYRNPLPKEAGIILTPQNHPSHLGELNRPGPVRRQMPGDRK